MSSTSPARLLAQLLLLGKFKDAAELQHLLAVFEGAADLSPTHWAAAQDLRDPYEARAILAAVQGADQEGIVPKIMRVRPPVFYSATWFPSADCEALYSLQIETKGEIEGAALPLFIGLVEQLASTFDVEWGHVDVRFTRQDPSTFTKSSGCYDHASYYLHVGPLTLYPRTIFGPRLLELAPGIPSILKGTLAPNRTLPNGCLQVDLVPEPWSSSPQALKLAQVALCEALQPVGLLARPRGRFDFLPGTAWLPPTLEDATKYKAF
jgi:hypothetical protein